MAVGIFAGVAVRDYNSAVDWYRRLLGAVQRSTRTTSRPCGSWPRIATSTSSRTPTGPAARSARDLGQRPRLGGRADRQERGLEPTDIEKRDLVWKYVFHDVNGDGTGIGGEV